MCQYLEPRLVWNNVLPLAAAVARHHNVSHFGMGDDPIYAMGGEIASDLGTLFIQRLIWHTNNLSAYLAYVDDIDVGPFGYGSDDNEEEIECVD